MDGRLLDQISRLDLFRHLTHEQLADLADKALSLTAAPGDILIRQSDVDRDYIVLLEGELEVRRACLSIEGQDAVQVGLIRPGAGVGEMALLSAVPRRASVVAVKPSRYLRFPAEHMGELVAWSQAFSARIRHDAHLRHRMNMVRQVAAFRRLPLAHVETALDKMRPVMAEAGETIVRQGDVGDSYFLIESGQAEVWRTDTAGGPARCISVLGAGSTFGEEALLLGQSRNATVTMTTQGRLWRLEKSDFDQLLKAVLVEEIDSEAALRMIQAGEANWIDCRFPAEFSEAHIPGAWPVPLDVIRESTPNFDRETTYIVYSREDRRSACGAFLLREKGYRALSLKGGLSAWPYALETSYASSDA